MLRVLVRSRFGNKVLAAIGGTYAIASLVVLAWLVADVWQAATASDVLVQFALVGCAACGAWFVINALDNLGVQWRHHDHGLGGTSNAASVHR